MIVLRVALLEDNQLRQGGAELLESWRSDGAVKLWVDIDDATHEGIEPLLETRFGFHELAAEDATSANTLPKYDPFAEYDFFIFRAVEQRTTTYKVAAFLGRNFLFTVHSQKVRAIENMWARLPADKRLLGNGTDFLLYNIVDQMVDAYFPLLDEIEEGVDNLQEGIFKHAEPSHLDELLHLKREINVLRRQSLPQRELLNQMSRGDAQFIQQQHLIYFRDIYDHMFRIGETIDIERDMMTGTMDAYLSVVANRTNETMKVLTIFSAIMLPLTLIAGIYGMNFEYQPEFKWRYGYWWALGLMAVIAATMLYWFWRSGWLGRTARPMHRRRRL